MVEILPQNVSLFFHFGVSNYGKYLESKKKYFKAIGREEAYQKKLDWLLQLCHFEIESDLKNWVANEFGMMYISHPGIEDIDSKIAYFRLSDQRKAKTVLDRLNDEGRSNNAELGENLPGSGPADPVNIGQPDLNPLFSR